MNIYCSYLSNSFGHFQSICNNQKLKQLNWQIKPFSKNSYDSNFVSRETMIQLKNYFLKELKIFEIEIDFSGLTKEKKLWIQKIMGIPYGEVWTYSDLAKSWGNIKASRAAGNNCALNLIPIIIPCHRVIGKNTFGKYSGITDITANNKVGVRYKRKLIELEKNN